MVPETPMATVQVQHKECTWASRVVPETWGVMAWFGMWRHGCSGAAGCCGHTSPAYPAQEVEKDYTSFQLSRAGKNDLQPPADSFHKNMSLSCASNLNSVLSALSPAKRRQSFPTLQSAACLAHDILAYTACITSSRDFFPRCKPQKCHFKC